LTHSGGSSPADPTPASEPAPPRKQFRLTGHSADLDASTNAVRGDLADVELADRVFAPHYAQAVAWRASQTTEIHAQPAIDAPVIGKLLAGDAFNLLDINAGWAWGRTAFAVGYVPAESIAP
jgi:Bacterial dipeptidyl-peptidase Sh3 domain